MKKLFLFISILFVMINCFDGNEIINASKPDKTKPEISITSPTNGSVYGSGIVIVQGTASDNLKLESIKVKIDDGTYTLAATMGTSMEKPVDWIYYLDTKPGNMTTGAHTITAQATDIWENTKTTTITINVNNTAPLAELLKSTIPPLMTNLTSLNITVGGTDIQNYQYQIDGGIWSASRPVTTPITDSGLSTGKHSINVRGQNNVGIWQAPDLNQKNLTHYEWSINKQLYFTAKDGVSNDGYGWGVSISADGTCIVVGAIAEEETIYNDDIGAVYIYKWNNSTWKETKIKASDGERGDHFGQNVSISSDGTTIVVGAYNILLSTGAAYVYKWNIGTSSWDETKLTPSDGETDDYFSYYSISTSADGTRIVVGAYGKGSNTGAVYIYTWTGSTWDEKKLFASDGTIDDQFGDSVSMSSDGQIIAVGAIGVDYNGYKSGSVYIYKWNGSTWGETKLFATDGTSGDFFGHSVSISSDGQIIAVGASGDSNRTGVAYVYTWTGSTWDEIKLYASDGTTGDSFGMSIFISGDGENIIVGANPNETAYVYTWTGSTWDETKLFASDGTTGDCFGNKVSISSDGNSRVVGAPGISSFTGAVYLFYE